MMKKKAFMSWLMVSKVESASTKATRKSNFPAEWLDWYSNGHEMGPTWLFYAKSFRIYSKAKALYTYRINLLTSLARSLFLLAWAMEHFSKTNENVFKPITYRTLSVNTPANY